MAHLDKNGDLQNSKADLDAFTAYCRSRVHLMENSDNFIQRVEAEFDRRFDEIFEKPKGKTK